MDKNENDNPRFEYVDKGNIVWYNSNIEKLRRETSKPFVLINKQVVVKEFDDYEEAVLYQLNNFKGTGSLLTEKKLDRIEID